VSLRKKDRRLFLNNVSERLGLNIESMFGSKPLIEIVETLKGKVYVIDGRPLIIESGGNTFPTLKFEEYVSCLPKVVVDLDAVPHICNKADVMGPGIVDVQGEFKSENLVNIIDVKNRKSIAIAKSIYDSTTSANLKKGKIFRNLHCIGDEFWIVSKEIEEKRKS